MKLLKFAAILPLTLGAPILGADSGQVSLSNMELKTMVYETNIEFLGGNYVLFTANRDNISDSNDSARKGSNKLEFPVPDGKLTVLSMSGKLVGNILPTSAGYNFNFASDWLTHPDEALPNVRESPTNSFQKRGAGLASVLAKMKPIGFWVNLTKAVAKFVNLIKSKPRSRRDDTGEYEFVEPVFVKGPGVNFASVLALGNVNYEGDAIQLVGKGVLFLDVDNVIDYQNCALCNLPTSS